MSGGAVYQQVLRILSGYPLPEVAHGDCVRALEANRAGGPLQFFYDVASEAGLVEEDRLQRSAGVFFCYAAGQLADDLADEECTYLEQPERTGPSVQFLLQNLFVSTICGRVPQDAMRAAADSLVVGTGPQQLEVRTSDWTLPLARQIAEGIAGCQIAAYLQILWSETDLAPLADSVGRNVGIAAHIVKDIQTDDPRYWTLPPEERLGLHEFARRAAEDALASGLRSVRAVVAPILTELSKVDSAAA